MWQKKTNQLIVGFGTPSIKHSILRESSLFNIGGISGVLMNFGDALKTKII